MEIENYSSFWDQKAASTKQALIAVDGSADESVARATGHWTAEQVATALDLDHSDSVLELGCGVGRIGRQLAPRCAQWFGTDISQRMLNVAAERLCGFDNVDFRVLPKTTLSMFDDHSISKAYSVAVLCHMDKEDLFLYLQELKRVVKPGGLIYVETWNLAHPIGWKRWQYEVQNWARSDQRQRKDVARNQFCTPDEFQLYVEQAGFQVLTRMSDSPWVQIVAGQSLDAGALADQQQRLEQQHKRIAYSDLFGRLFEKTVDVIFGVIHPRDMHAFMVETGVTPETELFTTFLNALWQDNAHLWGESEIT